MYIVLQVDFNILKSIFFLLYKNYIFLFKEYESILMLEAMFAESLSSHFFNIGVAWNIFNPQPQLLYTLSYYDGEDVRVSILHYFVIHEALFYWGKNAEQHLRKLSI